MSKRNQMFQKIITCLSFSKIFSYNIDFFEIKDQWINSIREKTFLLLQQKYSQITLNGWECETNKAIDLVFVFLFSYV